MDAQKLYTSIAAKQEAQQQEEVLEFSRDEHKMLLRKAHQGHIYGRTRHLSLEDKDNGRSASTSSEWSDASGTRTETAAIQRDDSTPEGESGAADGIAGETIAIATGGTGASVGGASAGSANSGQRKSARHSAKAVN